MLKVMIVDNESAIRKGLVHCIHWGDLGCEIAAQADDGMMALEQIRSFSRISLSAISACPVWMDWN